MLSPAVRTFPYMAFQFVCLDDSFSNAWHSNRRRIEFSCLTIILPTSGLQLVRGGWSVIELRLEGRVVIDPLLAERVLRTSSLAAFAGAVLSSCTVLPLRRHRACLLATLPGPCFTSRDTGRASMRTPQLRLSRSSEKRPWCH